MDFFFNSWEEMQYAVKQIHGEDNWRLLSKALENHYRIQSQSLSSFMDNLLLKLAPRAEKLQIKEYASMS